MDKERISDFSESRCCSISVIKASLSSCIDSRIVPISDMVFLISPAISLELPKKNCSKALFSIPAILHICEIIFFISTSIILILSIVWLSSEINSRSPSIKPVRSKYRLSISEVCIFFK